MVQQLKKEEQLARLEASFKQIDTSGDGELDCQEFVEFLHRQNRYEQKTSQNDSMMRRAMPFELRDIAERVVQAIDKDQNGTLSWAEFRNCSQMRGIGRCNQSRTII